MTEKEERVYEDGNRAAWTQVLGHTRTASTRLVTKKATGWKARA